MSSYHIAILETDTAPAPIAAQHGSYGNVIESCLRRGLVDAGNPVGELKASKWDVIKAQSYPAIDEVDAVFVTAGRHDADEDDPWVPNLVDFIQRAYKAEKPIMGLCYGHQIIARALGGKVSRNPKGWEITVKDIDLSPAGSKLFGKTAVTLHQMHRDAVIKVPPDIKVIGTSHRCDTQILYQPGRLLTTQGHPEFDALTCKEMLEERLHGGILSTELYEDAVAKADGRHDGDLFWKVAWKFLVKGKELELEDTLYKKVRT